MRLRAILGVVTLVLIGATYWVVAYANDLVVSVVPPMWIVCTVGLAILYRRLDAASPHKGLVLQLLLLLATFTLLFLAAYVPRQLEWLQYTLAGLMLVPLGALLWVRRRQRASGN